MMETVLFVFIPYAAVTLALGAGLYRYFFDRFSWSSQSSQFLEGRFLFWGSVPWHYAIILILLAHLLAFLIPGAWGELLGEPVRLYILEVIGLALAFGALIGLLVLILRRAMHGRVAAATTVIDWVVLLLLLVQTATGVYIALTLRWGSVWFLHTVVPWLWSLLAFNPQIQLMAFLPLVVKLHAANAFVLVALFPFSRLVHLVSIPVSYLGRPPQIMAWNGRRPH